MAKFCYFLDHFIRTQYRNLQSLLAVRGWTIEVKLLHQKIVFWQLATAVGKLLEDASQASDPCHSPDRPQIAFPSGSFHFSSLHLNKLSSTMIHSFFNCYIEVHNCWEQQVIVGCFVWGKGQAVKGLQTTDLKLYSIKLQARPQQFPLYKSMTTMIMMKTPSTRVLTNILNL